MLSPVEHCNIDELVQFTYKIYRDTDEDYPFFEWLSEKPNPSNYQGFVSVYHPFLKARLEHEFDCLYVWKDNEIIATIALVLSFDGKDIDWFP